MPEKRIKGRRFKRLRLKYGVLKPERFSFTEDISPDGLFIKTVRPLLPGEKVKVELYAPENKTVQIEGYVKWIKRIPPGLIHLKKKGGMGIRIAEFISGEDLYKDLCTRQKQLIENDD